VLGIPTELMDYTVLIEDADGRLIEAWPVLATSPAQALEHATAFTGSPAGWTFTVMRRSQPVDLKRSILDGPPLLDRGDR